MDYQNADKYTREQTIENINRLLFYPTFMLHVVNVSEIVFQKMLETKHVLTMEQKEETLIALLNYAATLLPNGGNDDRYYKNLDPQIP